MTGARTADAARQSRVVMVVGDFPPVINGIGDYSAQLVRALAARGRDVTVVTSSPRAEAGQWSCQGVEVKRVVPAWTLRHWRLILRALGPLEPGTIVHIQYHSPSYRRNPMINLLPAMLRVLRPACRVVMTVHEFRLQSPRWRARVVPMLLAAHGLLFADSDDRPPVERWTALTRPLMATVPIGSNITPLAPDPALKSRWRRELGIDDGSLVAIYFGELYEHKGIFELLGSLRRVRGTGLPVHLLVVSGSRQGKANYTERARRDLQQAVEEGWATVQWDLPPDLVSRALHAADTAVFPFTRGATPQRGSLIAAVCHQLPTITTRGPVTPAGFAEQFGVRLATAGDEESLATCLLEVLATPAERERLRQAAATASLRFSWERIASEVSAFYAAVRREGAAPPLRAGTSATSTARS